MRKMMQFAATLVFALAAPAAQAASVNLETVSGIWTGAGDESTYGLGGIGTNEINWGAEKSRAGQSGYSFDGSGGQGIELGQAFSLGLFTHDNQSIWRRGWRTNGQNSSISSASLNIEFDLDFGGGLSKTISSMFDFTHTETHNQARVCANGEGRTGVNANGCADRVQILNSEGLTEQFSIGGLIYEFAITGFVGGDEFWTMERATNSTELFAVLRVVSGDGSTNPPAPVPLPASGGILLGALAAAAAVSRRRKSA